MYGGFCPDKMARHIPLFFVVNCGSSRVASCTREPEEEGGEKTCAVHKQTRTSAAASSVSRYENMMSSLRFTRTASPHVQRYRLSSAARWWRWRDQNKKTHHNTTHWQEERVCCVRIIIISVVWRSALVLLVFVLPRSGPNWLAVRLRPGIEHPSRVRDWWSH